MRHWLYTPWTLNSSRNLFRRSFASSLPRRSLDLSLQLKLGSARDLLADALPRKGAAATIDAVLTDFSSHLVYRIAGISETKKQGKYLETDLQSAEPVFLQYHQRKFKPYQPRPAASPNGSYGVSLGHVPGFHTFWNEAHFQTIGVRSGIKRFKMRQHAENFVI